ncbi:MAG: hypothetical protein EPO40_24260 [Myxococcaceae bacterium]|nr:MAG: hypothetical protein EPO40_24260 [Myxococcaceae bacterium]
MAIKTPPPSSSGTFDDYVRCLRAEVDAAAKVRWEDPVAFLWRARRVGEALLHALRVRHVPGSGHEPSASIDGLLKHEQLRAKLGRENLIDLQGLQNLGNTGSHIQGEVINYEHAAGVAAAHLANVVAWFFRTQHPEAAVPNDVGRALDVMRERARWQSSPDNPARRAEERISHLMGELRAASEAARRNGGASDQGPTIPPRLSIGRTVLAALGVALPAFGGGLAAGRSCAVEGTTSPTRVAAPVTVVVPGTRVSDAGVVATGLAAPPVAVASPNEAPAQAPCRAGTVEVFAWPLRLLPPPHRPSPWLPRQPDAPAVMTTERVCLDTRAATVGELLRWNSSLSAAFNGCVDRRPADTAPMPCMRHPEAEAWCRSRGGRLPRVVEWEALARQPGSRTDTDLRVQPAAGWLEWTADPFPPAVFNLRPAGIVGEFVTRGALLPSAGNASAYPRYSWNRQDGTHRVHSIFVRCAFDPGAPAP